MASLFFSYSSRDRSLAQQLVAKLSQLGHRVAIDTDSLVPGVEWRRELLDKLLLSDGVVVLLTPNALGSPFVLSEIGSARASSKLFLIPVVVGNQSIHPVVQDIWAVPLPSSTPAAVSKAAKQIDEAVKTHLERSARLTTSWPGGQTRSTTTTSSGRTSACTSSAASTGSPSWRTRSPPS
jgi:hypothetical protein